MNDRGKLLSIIVSVYNVEKYIGQCLTSLIKQTYKNLEIIVINDGTKDNSAIIAKEYATQDNRIKVFDYPNGGASMARNRGLTHAHGEYVAFVDSDDWVSLDMYENLIHTLEKNNVDLVKCGCIFSDGNKEEKCAFGNDEVVKADIGLSHGNLLRTVVWNAVYTRDLVKKVKFPEYIMCEDNYASPMYVYYASKIAYVKECYYYYRDNRNGVSHSFNKRPLDRFCAFYRLKEDFAKDGG